MKRCHYCRRRLWFWVSAFSQQHYMKDEENQIVFGQQRDICRECFKEKFPAVYDTFIRD